MMDISFPDGQDFSSNVLAADIAALFERMGEIDSPDANHLTEMLDTLQLRITGSTIWRCEANGAYNIAYVSRKVFDLFWVSIYSHYSIYKHVFAGNQISGDYDAVADDELLLPRQMLAWARNDAIIDGDQSIPEEFPQPSNNFDAETPAAFARRVVPLAVFFHLLHELAHTYYHGDFDDQMEEEKACDRKAAEWLLQLPTNNDSDRQDLQIAVAAGMLYVAARGIDTGRHDGITHPFTYDRLLDTLESVFDLQGDVPWGFTVAVLSVHASNQNIELDGDVVPTDGFANFYDCVKAYRVAIHDQNTNNPEPHDGQNG